MALKPVKIKVVPKATKQDIERFVRERMDRVETAVLLRLQFVGEKFVINARLRGTYKDRTGNLRSSVGYVVLKNGQQVYENFKTISGKVKEGESKVSGTKRGDVVAKEVIAEIAQNYPTGFVLIAVAGMDYAASVESKGYDVISASSIDAQNDLEKGLKELKEKVSRMT